MALNGLKLARTRSLDHLPPAGGSRAVGLTSKLRCNQRSVAAWNIQRSWRLLLEFHPEARPKPVTLRSMDWFEGKSVLKKIRQETWFLFLINVIVVSCKLICAFRCPHQS
jgi:hypothetical protein